MKDTKNIINYLMGIVNNYKHHGNLVEFDMRDAAVCRTAADRIQGTSKAVVFVKRYLKGVADDCENQGRNFELDERDINILRMAANMLEKQARFASAVQS